MARRLPFLERNLRRARVYSGRVGRTVMGTAPRHPCLFVHMPKCGGTSIAEAIYATVPLGRGVAVIDAVSTRRAAAILAFGRDDATLCHEDLAHGDRVFALREGMMLGAMAWGAQVVHGHVLYSDRAEACFGEAYRLVTLLRDPADRMVSNYRMARRAGVVEGDLDAYLDGPVARNHARVYLRYLGGRAAAPDDGPDTEALTALAVGRLGRFAVLGFLDDLGGFARRYREAFGPRLGINGYNRGTGEAPDLTASQRARIEALVAPDRAIFDAARRLAA